MKKTKRGDRFIKPGKNRIYVVRKANIKGDWILLKEENGAHQILTSQNTLKTWRKYKVA